MSRETQIDRLGLLEFAEVGFEKPDVRIFEHACRVLDTKPSEIAHVGDEPDADANGA